MDKPITRTAAEWLAEVRRHERAGDLFEAYDQAHQGLAEHPGDWALKHRAVLCLASTGATRRALDELAASGIDRIAPEELAALPPAFALDLASLRPRLLKDAAVAARGPARRELLAAAAAAYEAPYRAARAAGLANAYYPGINCATLRLLAGDAEGAAALARELLAQLAEWPGEKSYYEIATELEAQLLTGDLARAEASAAALREALRRQPDPNYRDLASTIAQLRRIVAAKNLAFDPAAALAPPRVIHYLGHIISPPGQGGRFPAEQEGEIAARIAAAVGGAELTFAYGSLAAGADILFAEAVLARPGNRLHVVLPFDLDEFIAVSVRPAGEGWVERFHRCWEAARERRFATEDGYLGDDDLFSYCSQLAMGLALLRANQLSSTVEQIAVWDGRPPSGPAGTAVDLNNWRRSGRAQTIIPVAGSPAVPAPAAPQRTVARRTRAMLFGDIKGFSKLHDTQLPQFVDVVLGAVARVVDRFAADILLKNTWGDGLFLVFDDAGKAADCALALQEELAAVDLAAHGLPETMALRLGGHLGPVYTARDPVLRHDNFFGAHVSRAARIEPVTPEGFVYVTETLAAVLALHNADQFACHYVGITKAAKDYGEMRMFLLTRADG